MKKTYLFYLSDEYFKSTIKRFEELVRNKDFRKMDYGFWQNIRRWLQNAESAIQLNQPVREVVVSYTEGASVITLSMEGWGIKYTFSTDLGGFGEYLFTRLNVASTAFFADNIAIHYFTNEPRSEREQIWYMRPVIATATDPNNNITITSTDIPDLTLNWDDSKTAMSTTAETVKASNAATGYLNTYKSTGCPPPDYDPIYWGADKYIVPQREYEIAFKNTDNMTINDKENKEMNKAFKFDFGKITDGAVRMSMYGLAVKNVSGAWTAYDKTAGDLMDVDILNFDASNMLYKMPVAMKDIKVGDVIIHARKPMFVVGKTEADDLIAVDPVVGEKKTIMPAKSPFGFNFCTKVISLFDGIVPNAEASTENPFGNMWMLMLMDGSNSKDMLLPLMLMNQNGGTGNMNPMMLALMMSDSGDMKDLALPLMLMANK